MNLLNIVRSTGQALALMLAAPMLAQASTAYLKWVPVQAPVASGATCGNGTPFHFFVNRAIGTRKTLIYFEGGGACWQQRECLGKGKFSEVATNPNGVPANYFSQINLAAFGLVSPMIWRLSPLNRTVTQSWNLVYVPYCTGDVHTGNAVGVYGDQTPSSPLSYFHRGHVNAQQVAKWVAANLPSDDLLVSGFSAGSTGATANYAMVRDTVRPARSSMLNDAGPLFPAPQSSTAAQHPSLPLHNRIREAWGFDRPQGILSNLLARYPGMDAVRTDLGALNNALARQYPQDRFGYAVMQQDGVFSAFSYRLFNPDIAAISDTKTRDAAYNRLWRKDLANWTAQLDQSPNIGYYVPLFRPLIKSHTLTTLDYAGTAIEDQGYRSIETFIQNTLDRSKPPIRAVERDQVSDYFRPADGIQWLIYLFQDLLV